jgi:hypothetical protein
MKMISSELINSIKLKGDMPSDNYFTDSEFLSILNDELKLTINPLLMRLNEDYLTQDKDYTISSGSSYRLPNRCLGNKIRDVKIVDTAGAFTDVYRQYEENRSANPRGYYLKQNSLTLSDHYTSGTLRVSYFLRPNTLISASSAAQVLSIDSATQVTVSALPSTITTSTPVDFIQTKGPNDVLALDQTITSIAGTTLTFASLPDDLVVGDYICLAGESPVSLIPEDLNPVLVQAALCVCLSAKKDKAASFELEKLERMKQAMIDMLDPRVQSNDTKVRGQGLLSRFIRR